jgi:N-acetylglucosamine-6-phosphate deacetylase
LYNAMAPLAGRAPGIVGLALADDRLFAGIIADGFHVDPVSLAAALRAKGRDRLYVVTDAMATSGGTRSRFDLLGIPVHLQGGRLVGPDGTLAGAHLTMIEAVRSMVTSVGASLADALVMASHTPALWLGLDHRKGRIAAGFDADLVAFDGAFTVVGTWIGGRRLTSS